MRWPFRRARSRCRAGTWPPPGPAAGRRGTASCGSSTRARPGPPARAGRRVVQREVRGRAGRGQDAVPAQAPDGGRAHRHPVRDPGPVQQPGLHHGLLHRAQRDLQAGHAEGGVGPLGVLGFGRVRRVIGGHAVDRPVGQAGPEPLDVGRGPQRRVDLVHRVVVLGQLVGEQQMVRGDLGGDPPSLGLGPADDLDRPGRRDVADVQGRADVRGQQAVPGDDRLLGHGRPARQPQPPGHRTLVHLGVLGEPGLLGVLRDHAVERLDVLQRAAHQQRVGHAAAVVGEHPDPGGRVGHRAELGQPLASQAQGHGADGLHVTMAGLPAEPPHLLDHAGRIGDRLGVGHGVHRGVAAQRRRPGAGLDGLGVLAARLPQVSVQVNQPGQRDQPVRVQHLGPGRGQPRPGLRDHPVAEHQVGALAIGQGDVPDQPVARRAVHRVRHPRLPVHRGSPVSSGPLTGVPRPVPRRRGAGTARPSGR